MIVPNPSWYLDPGSSAPEVEAFGDLARCRSLEGELINRNRMSRLVKANISGRSYYIKDYFKPGKGLRRWVTRSRVRAEWENLAVLRSLGLPVPRTVACGESGVGPGRSGVLVTEAVPGVIDLASAAGDGSRGPLANHVDRKRLIVALASQVRQMHGSGFAHGDLKWRNILIDTGGTRHAEGIGNRLNPGHTDTDFRILLIDCPMGRRLRQAWLAPLLEHGIVKDLACLDKAARQHLTRTERLRFYYAYAYPETTGAPEQERRAGINQLPATERERTGWRAQSVRSGDKDRFDESRCDRRRLDRKHRDRIRRVLHYFSGRE